MGAMNTNAKNQLRINAFEMLRRPGTIKSIHLEVPPAAVQASDERLLPDSPIGVDLECESLSDGIVVRGRITAAFRGDCRRCLQPLEGSIGVDVRELYQVDLTDPDAFAIEGDIIDLAPMVRESVLLELPDGPLCRIDCAGLCATCGVDLNAGPCSCPSESVDPRWSALETLRDSLPE